MSDFQRDYQSLLGEMKNISVLNSCASVLNWDKEAYMPRGGTSHRANQLSLLAGMVHQRFTDPKIGDWLAGCQENGRQLSPDSVEAVNLREWRRDYERMTKVPQRLVEELARIAALSNAAWIEARRDSKFETFRPWLEKMIELRREQAQAYDMEGSLYDALIEDYEPGATSAQIAPLFQQLRESLVPMLEKISGAAKQPDVAILHRDFPVDRQKMFGEMAAAMIGFDFQDGRVDEVVHPFCTELGPKDTRITTRFNPKFFNEGFFGILHEAGHALYEQGLPKEHYGTPMGESVSMGIHESQSRLWENLVGRSRSFWRHFFPRAKAVFNKALADVSFDDFIHAINVVQPSFIRVEADEVTYNLHIILRFELEMALIEGDLAAADLPGAWNEKFKSLFGLDVPDDRRGCLQDVHWAEGLFGYFPTYALGNVYAAQLFEQAEKDIPKLENGFARGNFRPLLDWLRQNVHSQARRHPGPELLKQVTGQDLSAEALVLHLEGRFYPLYELDA